jgi:hypothetical protein
MICKVLKRRNSGTYLWDNPDCMTKYKKNITE